MRKLIAIFVFLIFSNAFCQETEWMEVKNIDVRTESLLDTLKMREWHVIDKRKQSKIRKYLAKQKLRIENDSALKTQVLYFGLPETIRIVATDFDKTMRAEEPSENYVYKFMTCYPINEKTYELIAYDRNSGIKEFDIYFIDSNRYAHVKVDTKFSEIYINPQFDIELIEFEEGTFATELDEHGTPKGAKEKRLKKEDEIIVDHRYARH